MAWTYHVIPDLSEEQLSRWQGILEERTGIYFSHHTSILQAGLTQRMREIDCLDYDKYYQQIMNGKGRAIEWTALLKTLTVKETSFFRHQEAFNYVKSHLFNRLLGGELGGENSIEMWSVGCSSGEEAYSLAMIANDCIEGLGVDNYFGVTASDICLSALAEARRGIYADRKLENVDAAIKSRYFQREQDSNVVTPWIKQRVCFVQTNIINMQSMPMSNMDVIFCQNVLIYFRRWRQKEVLDSFVNQLKPGGLLITGLGEAVDWQHPQVQRVQQKRVQAYVRI